MPSDPTAPIRFDDTAIAFNYKSDAALSRSHLLFRSIQSNFLVRVGPSMVNWALRLGLPIEGLLRQYFFVQFCGGEDLDDTLATSEQLWQYGVSTMLDYSVEAVKNDTGFDAVLAELLQELAHAQRHEHTSFVATKLTGLGSLALMEKKQAGGKLSGYELKQWDKLQDRLQLACKRADETGQCLMIDAEETWIQDVIDGLAEEMIFEHNHTRAVIYTTVQLYRHDRLAYLTDLIARCKAKGVKLGVKLVRGAYLEKETRRAAEMGYANPMQPNKANTDRDYDAAALLCLDNIDHVAMVLGTHNDNSCLAIASEMDKRGIDHKHPHVYFAQLLGMSDHISFNLARAGYNVGKYLPYGPLRAVLPYLFRRAEENTSIAGQSGRELRLIEQELKRRRQQRQLPHKAVQ